MMKARKRIRKSGLGVGGAHRMMLVAVLLPVLLVALPATAQKKAKVKLIKADKMAYDKTKGPDVQRIIGNVVFKHKQSLMWCDSAYFYSGSNRIKAYGQVHINDNDSVDIFSDSLHYSGDTRQAALFGRVKLSDGIMTLTTKRLDYDMKLKTAYYRGGGKIVDSANVLTSRKANYYVRSQDVFFKDSVRLVNEQYFIRCDTLQYNTGNGIARFRGPTYIESKENTIYCENGWYNTQNDRAQFEQNSYLDNGKQRIQASRMYYDRKRDYGQALEQVQVRDTAEHLTVLCKHLEYEGQDNRISARDSALCIMEDRNRDSLFMHADLFLLITDSARKAKELYAYHHVALYKSNLQGLCDSLVFLVDDSITRMYHQPVLWAEGNQITGDYMEFLSGAESLREMHIEGSAFMLSHDSLEYYNQISGRRMAGYFEDNEFRQLIVYGNAQTVYYARDEQGQLIGVDLSAASTLRIDIEKRQVKQILYYEEPAGTLYPLKETSRRDRELKGFKNLEYKRPKNRDEVFLHR